MLTNLFYWFFWPEIYVVAWHSYMLESILLSAGLLALGMLVYGFMPYHRKREPLKFWITFFAALVLATIYIVWRTTTIPDEYARGWYKIAFVGNFIVSSFLWHAALYCVLGRIFGAKRYFTCVINYFKRFR